MTGMLLSRYKISPQSKRSLKQLSSVVFVLICIFLPIGFPAMLTSANPQFALPAVVSILLLCMSSNVPKMFERVSIYLGTRSFSLYACHAPILWIYKRIIFGPTKGHMIGQANFIYFIGGLLLVLFVTEFLYRTVDLWAVKSSHKLRKNI